jgi:hypothetical protein
MILPSDVVSLSLVGWVFWRIWRVCSHPLPPRVKRGSPVYDRHVALDAADVARVHKRGKS